ncbi:MAG: hypothetical protein IKS11_10185 [Lachnospiraceae bacterium]|nr:hypothetical protein [Lachnospiraceae bacterium]
MKDRITDMLSDKGKRTAFDLASGIILYDLVALFAGAVVHLFFDFRYTAFFTGIFSGMAVSLRELLPTVMTGFSRPAIRISHSVNRRCSNSKISG